MARIGFHRAARAELDRSHAWYEERNPEAAQLFVVEVMRVARLVAEAPERWPIVRGRTRRVVLDRFPFALLYRYRPADELVWIVAVAHQRRRPGFWHGR